MPLDLLALTRTPIPGKIFHGEPPKVAQPFKKKESTKKSVLLASIGSLGGILANDVLYFINDHLGTPAKVVDDDGVVVWDADYLPFGETNVLTGTFDNKFRFPGQYLDDETGGITITIGTMRQARADICDRIRLDWLEDLIFMHMSRMIRLILLIRMD